jgi:hypothetical protein
MPVKPEHRGHWFLNLDPIHAGIPDWALRFKRAACAVCHREFDGRDAVEHDVGVVHVGCRP